MTLEEMKAALGIRRPAAELSRDEIPIAPGLYVWSSWKGADILYVGKASGLAGLRKRIWSQHLNPKYVETRESRFRPADDFQRGCNVLSGGRVCVDKSVFRRSLGRKFKLPPGHETVRHIRENLAVAWVTFTREAAPEIPHLERELIRDLRPSLNVNGTSSGKRTANPALQSDGGVGRCARSRARR